MDFRHLSHELRWKKLKIYIFCVLVVFDVLITNFVAKKFSDVWIVKYWLLKLVNSDKSTDFNSRSDCPSEILIVLVDWKNDFADFYRKKNSFFIIFLVFTFFTLKSWEEQMQTKSVPLRRFWQFICSINNCLLLS